MIDIHDAIYALNPSIVTVRGEIAYDKDENEVAYDMAAAQAKLVVLEAEAEAKAQAEAATKQSALNKLMALGLTEEEALALGAK